MMKAGASMKQAARAWKKGGKKGRTIKRTRKLVKVHKPRHGGGVTREYKMVRSKGNPKGGRKVAKGGFNQQKLFKLVRLAALAIPAAEVLISQDSMQNKMVRLGKRYTGFDMTTGRFDLGHLAVGYGPILGATLATYGIPKLAGIIRGI